LTSAESRTDGFLVIEILEELVARQFLTLPERAGQHFLSGQARDGQVVRDTFADPQERLSEVDEPGVLGLVPHLAPAQSERRRPSPPSRGRRQKARP
jgi:hypothetical protein